MGWGRSLERPLFRPVAIPEDMVAAGVRVVYAELLGRESWVRWRWRASYYETLRGERKDRTRGGRRGGRGRTRNARQG